MAAAFKCVPARPLKMPAWKKEGKKKITCLNIGSCHVSAVITLSFWYDRNLKKMHIHFKIMTAMIDVWGGIEIISRKGV